MAAGRGYSAGGVGHGNRWIPLELWLQSRQPSVGRAGIGRGAPFLMANRLPPVLAERTR